MDRKTVSKKFSVEPNIIWMNPKITSAKPWHLLVHKPLDIETDSNIAALGRQCLEVKICLSDYSRLLLELTTAGSPSG